MVIKDLNNPAHMGHSNYLISTNGRQAEQVFFTDNPLPEKTRQRLLSIAYGKSSEQCGFITKEFEVFPVANSHLQPDTNFYMSEEDAIPIVTEIYETLNSEILAIYHTHPNNYPWPSPRDVVGWPSLALGWRYLLVTRGDVTEWRLVGD